MRISWNNLIEDTTITASTERTGYPATNLIIPQLTRIFSFNTNSGNIVIDLSAATQIKSIIIGNTNITSSGTLVIEGNATDSWGAPSYSQAITINDDAKNQILYLDQTYRYFRIVFGTDATLSYVTVGHLFIGDYTQMPGINPELKESYETTSQDSITRSQQLYGNQEFNIAKIQFEFPGILTTGSTYATKNQIRTMWKAVENVIPFYMSIWESDLTEFPPLFCKFDQKVFDFNKKNDYSYDLSFKIREVL